MTNREKLFSMSDEELAQHNIVYHTGNDGCYYMTSDNTNFNFYDDESREVEYIKALNYEIQWLGEQHAVYGR